MEWLHIACAKDGIQNNVNITAQAGNTTNTVYQQVLQK
jgi:hypothetical protein